MTRASSSEYVAIPVIDPKAGTEHAAPVFGKVSGQDTMQLKFYVKQAREFQKAASDVPYLLANAANVFSLLHKITCAGFTPEEGELVALYDLCGRALDAAAEKEGEVLAALDMILRVALKHYPNEED